MNNLIYIFLILFISVMTPKSLLNKDIKNKLSYKDKITENFTNIQVNSPINDSLVFKLKTLDSLRKILIKNNKRLETLSQVKEDTLYYNTHLYIIKGTKFKKEFVKIIKK
jgi:hypothetical protein